MYKKLTVLLSTVCAFMATPVAATVDYCQPAGGLYAGLFGGANWLQRAEHIRDFSALKYQPGFVAGGMVGYRFVAPLRFEGEVAYRQNSLEHIKHLDVEYGCHTKSETWSYMGNLLVDFNMQSVKPYAGVGLGYTETDGSDTVDDAALNFKNQGYAWQGIVGVAIPMANTMDLAVEYRYFQAKKHIRNHSVGASLKHFF